MFLRSPLLLFVAISSILVTPYLLLHSTNIVTNTYHVATANFFSGNSPYLVGAPNTDLYKYSPFFCYLYYPFLHLHPRMESWFWGLLNICIFWFGVSLWSKLQTRSSAWVWFAFIACSMELDGSIRYQQVNAFLIGTVLIALALYQKERLFPAGLLLAMATNVKVFPIFYLAPLLFPLRKSYLWGVLWGALVTFLVPSFEVGITQNLQFHREWISRLVQDTHASGLLDLGTLAESHGVVASRWDVTIPIFAISMAALVAFRSLSMRLWIATATFLALLVSPRTESPTFVLVGPMYILLVEEALQKGRAARTLLLYTIAAGTFLITLCQNDLWPKFVWNPASLHYANKTLGTLLLWCLAVISLILSRRNLFKHS